MRKPWLRESGSIFERMADDGCRHHVQMIVIPMLWGFVSFGMFILDFLTHKTLPMYAAGLFAMICFFNSWLTYRFPQKENLSYAVFEVGIFALFLYFLITGGTAGFSVIWICILPAAGPMLFGRKRAISVCGAMFAVILFLLWTPWGNGLLLWEYTPEFRMRFPIVYCAFFAVGMLFEDIRFQTNRQLMALQKKYRDLSQIDGLTQIHNRPWFYENLAVRLKQEPHTFLLLMADIDFFKAFNDRCGHLFGDEVLQGVAAEMQVCLEDRGMVCRWGGEEFFALAECRTPEEGMAVCEELRGRIARRTFISDDGREAHVTVSVGAAFYRSIPAGSPQELVRDADRALYKAKNSGRDRTVLLEM